MILMILHCPEIRKHPPRKKRLTAKKPLKSLLSKQKY